MVVLKRTFVWSYWQFRRLGRSKEESKGVSFSKRESGQATKVLRGFGGSGTRTKNGNRRPGWSGTVERVTHVAFCEVALKKAGFSFGANVVECHERSRSKTRQDKTRQDKTRKGKEMKCIHLVSEYWVRAREWIGQCAHARGISERSLNRS
jgi:hypothetical protein